jgi:membrane-associated phospholipid phosphatase
LGAGTASVKRGTARVHSKMENFGPGGIWSGISLIGSPVAMAIVCALLAVLLLRSGNRRVAIACVLIASLGGLLNSGIKALVHRPRPPGAERYLYGHSWSFPSGHAMGSLIGYGMLSYCALTYLPASTTVRRTIVAVCAAIVVAVGVSRIELGVHYRGDVVGGWLIGAVWLASGIALLRRIESQSSAATSAPITPVQ